MPRGFRLQARRFFLTFPQCATTKETAIDNAHSLLPDINWIVVCEEKHQDGSPHLHVALELKEKKHIRDPNFFDPIGGQHGNYQAMKNKAKCIEYVIKAGDFIAEGIVPQDVLKKKDGRSSWAAKRIMAGATLEELNEEDPGFVLLHKRKIEEYGNWLAIKKQRHNIRPWRLLHLENLTGTNLEIAQWLNENMFVSRSFKQPQLYIHGVHSLGKTSLIRQLSEFANIYHVPLQEDFYDMYNDEDYDLAVIDEFKGQKMIQWLNSFLDGSVVTLRKKGGQIMKKKNIPVIICSNYAVYEVFHKANPVALNALRSRLKEVHVTQFIDLDFNSLFATELLTPSDEE